MRGSLHVLRDEGLAWVIWGAGRPMSSCSTVEQLYICLGNEWLRDVLYTVSLANANQLPLPRNKALLAASMTHVNNGTFSSYLFLLLFKEMTTTMTM